MLKIYADRQLSFADYLLPEALAKNPLLTKVDTILTDNPELLNPLVSAYQKDRKEKEIDHNFGRPTVALETFIRLLLLKYLHKNCDLREVENRTKTDLAWKAFAKLSTDAKVPDFTTLNKWELFFDEEIIRQLHDKLISYCEEQKLVKGRVFRTDTTVTEANIHYPTDASLLKDVARVITRTVQKIKTKVKQKIAFRSRMKAINNKVYGFAKVLKNRTNQAKANAKKLTKEIAALVKKVLAEAETVSKEPLDFIDPLSIGLTIALSEQVTLGKKLLDQTMDVLADKKIKDRIVSFFQPKMRPIVKGKVGKPVEFGKKIEISEAEHNIITDYQIHTGNPNDAEVFLQGVKRHKKRFQRPPRLVATDRGGWSQENVDKLKTMGVKQVSIPQRGNKTKQRMRTERSDWFKAGQRWRAGGEGKISWLKRTFGMGKSRAKTERGFDTGVGMSVLACNLKQITKIA
jgi:IS5 family transposase